MTRSTQSTTHTYFDAGVDIVAGNTLVDRIKPAVKATARPGSVGGIGGFAGLFDLKAAGFTDPLLVSSTDGVGTKILLAVKTGLLEGIGQDLVAMCVNDILVCGAQPLFFLDYFATGKLDVDKAAAVIEGIAQACRDSDCALIGGETAEMPGVYKPGDMDLAGFAVGAVERGELIDGSAVREGDIVLGLPSSGVHANGFSLVRRLLETTGAALDEPAPFDGSRTLAEALLAPTCLYVRPVLAALKTGGVNAMVHITGGGFTDNVPRVLPAGLSMQLNKGSWPVPGVFDWLQRAGNLSDAEMHRTFNNGLGMLLIVNPGQKEAVLNALQQQQQTCHIAGIITKSESWDSVILS